MRAGWLLLLLLFAGCRYTFWPPVPDKAGPPELPLIDARLEEEGDALKATLAIAHLPEPGYLALYLFAGGEKVWEESLFVNSPTTLTLKLPKAGPGPYRLEVHWRGERVALALYGFPSPPSKAPPEWKEN